MEQKTHVSQSKMVVGARTSAIQKKSYLSRLCIQTKKISQIRESSKVFKNSKVFWAPLYYTALDTLLAFGYYDYPWYDNTFVAFSREPYLKRVVK